MYVREVNGETAGKAKSLIVILFCVNVYINVYMYLPTVSAMFMTVIAGE